jgi:repressor LexA
MVGSTREKVYRFVRARILTGVPPTVREVQERFGFQSVSTAREHLDRLIAERRLVKVGGIARGFRLPGWNRAKHPSVAVPLLGRVQGGMPTLAVEEIEETILVESAASEEEDLFALRVRGDSMRGAGILEGDVVIVRRQTHADDGDIVVALLGEEATVKRLRKRREHIELHPANPNYKPIPLQEGDGAQLLGKVIEVRRYL